jgi:CRISPR-associated endonuclease/helicase Cas3
MSLSADDFYAFHLAVHGKPPFGWQSRLLAHILRERQWPRLVDLPTGTGKTTCIDIAVFALALDAGAPPADRWCPRRIAMVVDRRIVVDQVAERGRKLLRALTDDGAGLPIRAVASALRSMCREGVEPLGVFTLRGGIPKDNGWARTPDQPLVLASTVDQLGSRLLFQGYGVSTGMRPVHAGLLANDLLLLLDEVHLSQPFAETLDALSVLRRRFEADNSLPRRFQHVFLSATPGTTASTPFRLEESEKAPASPLGPRLGASKPATLLEVADRSALEGACQAESRDLLQRHDVLAIIVNRVASARSVARSLQNQPGVDVVLLTGRMRPLDRDDIMRTLRARVMTGRERPASGKLVVVGTQCLEAGADFDFDALITESASLDALRQRFGRLDRLGQYGRAEGVIVHEKSDQGDPVYGEARTKTVAWIKRSFTDRKRKRIDFGILTLPLPHADDLAVLLAPQKHAPILLPAYLDLWMQSSPAPAAVPDLGLWLHGPDSGPPDVQVIWRADLTEDDLLRGGTAASSAASIVGAVHPSSLEAISVPIGAARRWLAGVAFADFADVEAAAPDEDDEVPAGSRALRWRGEDSDIVGADDLRPGDTIVIPATRGGISDGSFDPESTAAVGDLAERAAFLSRGTAALRLQAAVLEGLGLSLPTDEPDQARQALLEVAKRGEIELWRGAWLRALSRGRTSFVVPAHDGWTVLEGRRVTWATLRPILEAGDTVEQGTESTTEEQDSSFGTRAISLSKHSEDVERFARDYASKLGLPRDLAEDIALAAWLHDIGKADPRFQLLLRGGDVIELYKDETPLAKSAISAAAASVHKLARGRSGYPAGARHEIQSVAMIEKNIEALKSRAADLDLVLYLVGSHHGYARPFAPVVIDEVPVDVALIGHTSNMFGTMDFGPTSSANQLHRLDSSLPDRFWQLTRRYGWQGLCWLEAILRLADHRASEWEQREEDEP